jgi:hypothetical protein
MGSGHRRKKAIEKWFLEAARSASVTIPAGEIENFEEPDFKLDTAAGPLGVEVTELLRGGTGSFLPVAEEKFHKEVIQFAENEYYRTPGALPVRVLVYFRHVEDRRHDKRDMVRALVEFVKSHYGQATPMATFSKLADLPEGFGVVHVDSTGDHWTCGESGVTTVSEIYEQLASRISAKNKLLPTYRARLPHSAIWLLLYSGVAVSRGVPIPHGLSERTFQFDFERVLFFSCLSNELVEIPRDNSGGRYK